MFGSAQHCLCRARAAALAAALVLASALAAAQTTALAATQTTVPAAAQTAAQSDACGDPPALRFSLAAGGKPAQQLKLYLPVLDVLAAETGRPVDVFLPGSDASAVEALGGWVHFAVLSPEVYLDARAANPAISPFATPGRPPGHLQSEAPGHEVVLIARAGASIKKLRAARGSVAGLADREGTLAYRVPAAAFAKRADAGLAEFFSELVVTGGHEDSAEAVVEGRLDVAFVPARALDRMIDKQKLRLAEIKLLWRSPPLPDAPLVYDNGLCEDLKRTIAETFLTLHTRFELRQFLEHFKSPRMLPVTDADYDIIRDLRALPAEEPTE